MSWLLDPLQYAFMLRGLAAAMMVGVVCAVVGSYVVLRGMAFYGGALAHAVLPGVAVGYLLGQGDRRWLFWWGVIAAILSAAGIGLIRHYARLKEDTAIGIIFAGMFALGIAIISTVRNYTTDLTHFLFGDILGVTTADLWLTGIFSVGILLVVLVFYKEFLVISFDPVLAVTLRLPVKALDFLLLGLVALTIVVSLQTVGITLMVAMLVAPAATAYLVTSGLSGMMLLASLLAALEGVVGLYISYYAGIASGPAIVLTGIGVFLLVWAGRQIFTSRSA